jgi:RNA polymerase sigma-70 factor (ECF subfamily)
MKDGSLTRQAFRKLFLDNIRPLTMYAMQYVNDPEGAEDIVQDVFLYIYEKRDLWQVHKRGNYYLYRLVRYRCLNYLDHQKVRLTGNPSVREQLHQDPEDPLETIQRIELEYKYLDTLENLPPKCRRVFEMSRNEGKSNQEIADELNLSRRTVESHISLALKVLRRKLRKYL